MTTPIRKRRFLGHAMFFAPHWDFKTWQFCASTGIHRTATAARETFNSLSSHCLHRETRRVFSTTKLNVGSYDYPRFVKAGPRFLAPRGA